MGQRLVTVALLKKHRACADQRDQFEAEWPEGMAVTVENLARCRALGLDVEWGVHLLSKPQRAAYEAAEASAGAAYEAAEASAGAARDATMVSAGAAYHTAQAEAWAAYTAATDAVLVAAWEGE